MEELVKTPRIKGIEIIPAEEIASSDNTRVKKVLKKLEDESFLERIYSYRETYWDHDHSQTW